MNITQQASYAGTGRRQRQWSPCRAAQPVLTVRKFINVRPDIDLIDRINFLTPPMLVLAKAMDEKTLPGSGQHCRQEGERKMKPANWRSERCSSLAAVCRTSPPTRGKTDGLKAWPLAALSRVARAAVRY